MSTEIELLSALSKQERDILFLAADRVRAAHYHLIAAIVVLLYDHLITFSDEVELIWKRKKTIVSYLYLTNRYFTPLAISVVVTSVFSNLFTGNVCERYSKFEGAATFVSVGLSHLIMIMRTWALWGKDRTVLGSLACLFAGEIAIMSYALTGTAPLPLPPYPSLFRGCILVGTAEHKRWEAAFVLAPLTFDLVIFILTLIRSVIFSRRETKTHLIYIMIRDGALYFLVVFASNMVWALMLFTAPEELKNINAWFTQIITVVLMSRLTLNLRSDASTRDSVIVSDQSGRLRPDSRTYQSGQFKKTVGDSSWVVGQESFTIPQPSGGSATSSVLTEDSNRTLVSRDSCGGIDKERKCLKKTDLCEILEVEIGCGKSDSPV